MSFFKPNRLTPELIAEELFKVVQKSEEAERDYHSLFKTANVDIMRGLVELFYLRAIAVEYATFMALGGHPSRDSVLAAYRDRVRRFVDETGSSAEFDVRQLAYVKVFKDAIKKEHNPLLAIAFKFEEFCDSRNVVLLGVGTYFGGYLKATRDFLEKIKMSL